MNIIAVLEKMAQLRMKKLGVQSRMIRTPVGRQHLFDIPGKGNLPPIVILHGIGGGATPFEKLITILQRFSRRILVPEAPAHGFSEDPLFPVSGEVIYSGIASIINSELDEPAIIFGNSMGGAIALKYAIEYPSHVLGLVLSSPGGAQMEPEEWEKFKNVFRIKDYLDAINFANDLSHKPSLISVFAAGHLLSTLGSPIIQELLNNIPADYLFKPEELKCLPMPISLIWGKSDKIMLPRHLEFFRKNLPEHTLIEEPEDFGHCPYIDKPVQVAARIIDFTEKVHSGALKVNLIPEVMNG
jgi:pimeloyl-ACP methyl ester carboxylesterase